VYLRIALEARLSLAAIRPKSDLRCQYLYFCTSKASKVSTNTDTCDLSSTGSIGGGRGRLAVSPLSSPSSSTLNACIRQHTSAYVSIRQHTSAYVSIRQHTSAYVSIRQHTSAYVSIRGGARKATVTPLSSPPSSTLNACMRSLPGALVKRIVERVAKLGVKLVLTCMRSLPGALTFLKLSNKLFGRSFIKYSLPIPVYINGSKRPESQRTLTHPRFSFTCQ
jgi:hypothetical protein